MNLTKNSKK